MKVCKTCKTLKELTQYSKCSPNVDGLQNICKKCAAAASVAYSRTIRGFVVKVHQNQKHSSKRRGHPMPSYSRKELEDWLLTKEEFLALFKAWEDSGYERDLAPSLDRDDESIGYTLDNITLMPWYLNNERQYKTRIKEAQHKHSTVLDKKHVPIRQYDLDGNLLAEFTSIKEAAKASGVNKNTLYKIVSGHRGILPGDKFIWKRGERRVKTYKSKAVQNA